MILSGIVFSGTQRLDKPGALIADSAPIEIKERKDHPWVSRGGIKLDYAIKTFNVDVKDKIALDVGASTGGFTDVLLHYGAAKVFAVDVGYGQLAWKLQQNPCVVVLDRTNAKHLTHKQIPDPIDIIVADVSFIGLDNVLIKPLTFIKKGGIVIALIKPQFEVDKGQVGKGGIVSDPALHEQVCQRIHNWFLSIPNAKILGLVESPIHGTEGNKEFLIGAKING